MNMTYHSIAPWVWLRTVFGPERLCRVTHIAIGHSCHVYIVDSSAQFDDDCEND
jgi:hypothetical protein